MGASACAASVTPSDRWRLLAADGVAREVPHASQKLAPGRFSAPQASQGTGSGAAHSLQNFAPVRFSPPQRGQRMVMPSLCKRLMRLGTGWDWGCKVPKPRLASNCVWPLLQWQPTCAPPPSQDDPARRLPSRDSYPDRYSCRPACGSQRLQPCAVGASAPSAPQVAARGDTGRETPEQAHQPMERHSGAADSLSVPVRVMQVAPKPDRVPLLLCLIVQS